MASIHIMWFCAFHLVLLLASVLHTVSGIGSLQIDEESSKQNDDPNHVKTIKTEYGDIYDCVELYKQPAFDHPLLKDHKIQMKPIFALQKTVWGQNSSSSSLTFGLKESCPSGTVPILRTTKEQQLAAKASFAQFQGSSLEDNGSPLVFAGLSSSPGPPGHHPKPFVLAKGYVSTHNPTVNVQQISASVISLEHGPLDQFAMIRFGWMVSPMLYGDNHTRLYALWSQTNNGIRHGCFNTYCPGFVQTNPRIPLNMVIEKISGPQGEQLYVFLRLMRDKATRNWYVYFGDNKEAIGYWPPNLFNALSDGAETVLWGGMVLSSSQKLPDMGSGETGDVKGSHFRKVFGAEDQRISLSFNPSQRANLGLIQTKCYQAGDNSYKDPSYWGYSFWFGGKGGDVEQCK